MKNWKTIGLILALTGPLAEAKQYPELTKFVTDNAVKIGESLNLQESKTPLNLGGAFTLRRFFLRLQAKVGFNVEFANIDLIPELELVFQKEKTALN